MRLYRFGSSGLCDFQLTPQVGQPVQLLQTQRGGRGGVGRASAVAVPAPQIACLRHKALARQQIGLQTGTIGGIDNADLADPAGQNVRHIDNFGQGPRPSRQRLRTRISGQFDPARRVGREHGRCLEIIRQCRAQSRLESAGNGQQIKHLATCPRIAFDQPRQCANFGLQRFRLAFCR